MRSSYDDSFPIGAKYLTHEEARSELREIRADLAERRPNARGFAAWATRMDALTMAIAALNACDAVGVGVDP